MQEFVVGICDDEAGEREKIQLFCEQYFRESGQKGVFVSFSSGEEVLAYKGKRMHLLFLDVEMEEIDGLQVLRELEQSNLVWRVVIVTSHRETVFDSFGIKTLGFEEKPACYVNIEKWLQIASREHKKNRVIECNTMSGKRWIELEDLCYLEAQRNYVKFCTREEELLVAGNLKAWEEKLSDAFLVRVHKTYLVNLMQVRIIGTNVKLKDGRQLPIGRAYKNKVLDQYHKYICRMADGRM